jgi:hypothetical protein
VCSRDHIACTVTFQELRKTCIHNGPKYHKRSSELIFYKLNSNILKLSTPCISTYLFVQQMHLNPLRVFTKLSDDHFHDINIYRTQSKYWTSLTGCLDKRPRNRISNKWQERLVFYFILLYT